MWSLVNEAPIISREPQDAPPSRIAAVIIYQGIREGTDTIQLVPSENGLRVEYLIENAWRETMFIPNHLNLPPIEKYKEIAGLPLGYRMALEGLIPIRYGITSFADLPVAVVDTPPQAGEQDYDVCLFISPTRDGEKITMRIKKADSFH